MPFDPTVFLGALDLRTLPEQLVNGLLLGAIYALIALGYTMVYGVLRLINFAHGEVFMFGAYVGLFVSYMLGYSPTATGDALPIMSIGVVIGIGGVLTVIGGGMSLAGWRVRRLPDWVRAFGGLVGVIGIIFLFIGFAQPQALNLVLMLLSSMFICALLGVVIERFAYRPMRGHSRIASLITAIGISLLLQYGGALFLPNSPPPSIKETVNPYRNSVTWHLTAPDETKSQTVRSLEPAYLVAKKAFDEYVVRTKESEFSLSPEGKSLRTELQKLESPYLDAKSKADSSAVTVTVQVGKLITLGVVVMLMIALTYLVMKTPQGRAMRAVSHDFDSASLMGVNVNSIITFTFVVGSALAGAGAMMTATFQGTPLSTFYGLMPGVKAFVAAVLGGIGSIPGAVLGGILMGLAETVVLWLGYGEYKDAIAFVVLIVVLMFRPGGIMGSSKVEKV